MARIPRPWQLAIEVVVQEQLRFLRDNFRWLAGGFLLLMLEARRQRIRAERGASAVEWVIIAAIVVGICIAIAAILKSALVGEAGDIGDQIQNQ